MKLISNMYYDISKGSHRATPPTVGLYIGKRTISRKVTFLDSCRYTLPDGDQEDVNKLFGIGYFWSHHTDSARFGWRYNSTSDSIEILSYCYINKERTITKILSVEIGKEFTATLDILEDAYIFTVKYLDNQDISHFKTVKVAKTHNKIFGYPLGLYFGGNQVAPHDMTIKINK